MIYDDVRHIKSEIAGPVANDDQQPLVIETLLLDRGITNAKELVSKYDEKRIKDAIDNFDDRKAHGEDIGAGWLGKAIVHPEGFSFRKGFERASAKKPKGTKKRPSILEAPEELKETEAEAAMQEARRIRNAEFLARISELSAQERDALETDAIRRAHAAGNRFIADHVQKLRREGESLESTGAIRQQFWWEYILGEVETREALVTA